MSRYCPGGQQSFPCPAHSDSPEVLLNAGSFVQSDCVYQGASQCACVAGFHGTTQDDCQVCPSGSYCSGNNSIAVCPQHSESKSGSTSPKDCTCKAGYFEPSKALALNIPPVCVLCPSNTYCPGGESNLQCVDNAERLVYLVVVNQFLISTAVPQAARHPRTASASPAISSTPTANAKRAQLVSLGSMKGQGPDLVVERD